MCAHWLVFPWPIVSFCYSSFLNTFPRAASFFSADGFKVSAEGRARAIGKPHYWSRSVVFNKSLSHPAEGGVASVPVNSTKNGVAPAPVNHRIGPLTSLIFSITEGEGSVTSLNLSLPLKGGVTFVLYSPTDRRCGLCTCHSHRKEA